MTEQHLPDDEINIELRSLAEIAGRLIVLASHLRRAFLESSANREESVDELFDLRHWLHEMDLVRHATTGERRLIDARLGSLTEDETDGIALDGESLVALGWAVYLTADMPSYDQFASPAALFDSIPQPWDAPAPFRDGLVPRSDDTIAAERERAELWLWRAEIETDRQAARGQERQEIDAVIRDTAREAASAGLIGAHDDRDFELNGSPFRQLSLEAREVVSLVAERRLHALNWLCGFGADWDHVSFDV